MWSQLVNFLFSFGRIPLLASSILIIAACRVTYILWFSPLADIPGPFLARFTSLWELYHVRKGNSHLKHVELHKKYGPVVRIGPQRYSFSQASDMKTIYAFGGKFPKSAYYDVVGNPHRRSIFNQRDIAIHSEKRRKVSSLYSMSTVVSYEPAVDRMTALCLDLMQGFADKRRWVGIPQLMQFYAFDVIGEITVGHNFNMMEKEQDFENVIQVIRSSIMGLGNIGLVPWLHPYLVKARELFSTGHPGSVLEGIVVKQIEKHRGDGLQGKADPRSESFVTKLVQLEEAQKVSFENMMDACTSNFAAGSDTTGITISAALYFLYTNPHTLDDLRRELDDKDAKGQLSDPVTFHEAQNMEYLQAAIKETLRLHPAVATILVRNVPHEGVELAGHYFPRNSEVGCNAWVLHRHPEAFRPDPETFRPRRWLDQTNNNLELMNTLFIPFGAGSRVCIGKNISMLEMCKVIPQIVRNFDLEFEYPNKAPEVFSSFFAWLEYNCRITRRELAAVRGSGSMNESVRVGTDLPSSTEK